MSDTDGIELELDGGPTHAPRNGHATHPPGLRPIGPDARTPRAIPVIRVPDPAPKTPERVTISIPPAVVAALVGDAVHRGAALAAEMRERADREEAERLATIAAAVAREDARRAEEVERAGRELAAEAERFRRDLGVEAAVPETGRATGPAGAYTRLTRTVPSVPSGLGEQDGRRMRAGEMVAGAAAEGHGVLLGWRGADEMTREDLISAVDAYLTVAASARTGLDRSEYTPDVEAAVQAAPPDARWPEVDPPAAKSAHAHAGEAVSSLDHRGYKTRALTRRQHTGNSRTATWIAGHVGVAGTTPGDPFGRIALTISLVGDDLTFDVAEGHTDAHAHVLGLFRKRQAAEVYQAGDVTDWLASVLSRAFGAYRLGGNWYVRREYAAAAEVLCTMVAGAGGGWGRDWMLPALPIANGVQLRAGLSRGLVAEARAVLADLETRRADARKESQGRRTEIGPAAAARLLSNLQRVADRARDVAALLGGEALTPIRDAIRAAVVELTPIADEAVTRGLNLDLHTAPVKRADTGTPGRSGSAAWREALK